MGVWSDERHSSGKTETRSKGKLSDVKIKLIIELLRALLNGKWVGMYGIEAKLSPSEEVTSTSKLAWNES
jgi:hypothetical protein